MFKKKVLPTGTKVEGCTAPGNGPYDPGSVLREREYCPPDCRVACPGPEHCFKVEQATAAKPLETYISNQKS